MSSNYWKGMRNKITAQQYAIFLYEITRKESEVKKMTQGFLEILAKNNDLGEIDEIIREFEMYEKKQKGITGVELVSAKPIAAAVKKQISELIKDGKPEIQESVNSDLLGGITLIIGDMMIDASLRRKLGELKKVLS